MDNLLAKLYLPFDIAVFSKEGYGHFKLRSQAPKWLNELVPENLLRTSCYLDEIFPFSECFMPDFEQHWKEHKATPLNSDVWVEHDSKGKEIPLEASATWLEGSAFILIKNLGKKYQDNVILLQTAREYALAKERLEDNIIERTQEIKNREEEIAIRLSNMTYYKDTQTGEHNRRMGHYAAIIATALAWEKDKVEAIRLAATMHDIGKIALKDTLLPKEGKLNKIEFKEMQRHTIAGYNMLHGSNIPVLDMAATIALSHHEKWDGTGYPNGTSGTNIPIEARITAIIDIYDALIHKRVYNAALSEEETIEYLHQISGSHIDPNLFIVFLKQLPMIRKVRDEFPF